jgi:hypothetical protein
MVAVACDEGPPTPPTTAYQFSGTSVQNLMEEAQATIREYGLGFACLHAEGAAKEWKVEDLVELAELSGLVTNPAVRGARQNEEGNALVSIYQLDYQGGPVSTMPSTMRMVTSDGTVCYAPAIGVRPL